MELKAAHNFQLAIFKNPGNIYSHCKSLSFYAQKDLPKGSSFQ